MSTTEHGALPNSRTAWLALAASVLVGLAGGVVTFLAEGLVDSPVWFGVFHTIAPWAMVAAGAGVLLRERWPLAAMAGLLSQLSLVVGYYVGQHLLTEDAVAVR